MDITLLTPIAMIILVAVIAISIGATVLAEIQGTQTEDSMAYNITGSGIESIGTFGDFFPVIVIVAVASIIIGLVSWFGNQSQA